MRTPASRVSDMIAPPAPFASYGPWTPVPNVCLDRMPALSDTELRLLLAVLRQTLGWQDPATGHRKERDWLSQRRLMALTGRSNRAVSAALEGLVTKGLVEARGTDGRALDTSEGRRAAGKLWLAPGTSLRSINKAAGGRPTDSLTDLARDVFGAPAGGETCEERSLTTEKRSLADEVKSLAGGVRATPAEERSVTKGHSTKETRYKILTTAAVQKPDTGGTGYRQNPVPPAKTAPFSPASEALMDRFARYESESTGRTWRWDAHRRAWVKDAADHAGA